MNMCELSKTPTVLILIFSHVSSSDTFLFQSKFCVCDGFWRMPRFAVCVNAAILSRNVAADSKSSCADACCICCVKSVIMGSLFPDSILRAIRTFSAYF